MTDAEEVIVAGRGTTVAGVIRVTSMDLMVTMLNTKHAVQKNAKANVKASARKNVALL
jgi:hypothetical protein